MFNKRHEQELAEIKAMTHQLEERFQEIVDQLERIRENQERLAAGDRAAGRPKRKQERVKAGKAEAGSEVTGAAKGQGRKSGGSGAPKSGRKRRSAGAASSAEGGRRGRKGRSAAAHKGREAQSATSTASTEE